MPSSAGAQHSTEEPAPPPMPLPRLFARFLRFGLLAFGGPIAQLAMLRDELVERERWTTPERFHRALAIYQALPGPEAHEMCCWFGHLARGRLGSLVAGLGFLLPGFLLMLACSWLYVRFGMRAHWVQAAFAGMQPVVVALVVRAVPRIAGRTLRPRAAWLPATFGFVAGLADLSCALPLLFGAAWLAFGRRRPAARGATLVVTAVAVAWLWPSAAASSALANHPDMPVAPASFGALLALGLQAGLLTFGGAYTAIPVVREVVVVDRGWLQPTQFLDGLAIGGVLPAPLVIFGTFTGYVAGGLLGALAMTLGIFAPAFSFTLVGHAVIERAMNDRRLHGALDGAAAAVTGLIAATAWQLLAPVLDHAGQFVVFTFALLLAFRLRTGWATPALVGAGAACGWMLG